MSSPSFDVEVLSSMTCFPESRNGELTTVPLSIIDCSVAFFTRCAAIWYFDPPAYLESALSSEHLQVALSKTLNAYPQWCGRATYTKYTHGGGHTKRYRRVNLTFNSSTDIGVLFVTGRSPKVLSEFLPDPVSRKTSMKVWDGSQVPSKELYPQTPLSLAKDPDAPNVVVQFTTFGCGSTAISISITHALADAQTLSQFAKDYASVSKALFNASPLPILSPVFDPSLIDNFSAGDIDAEMPNVEFQNQARKLSCHRYDRYRQGPGQSWPADVPADFGTVAHLPLSPSTLIPWNEWDLTAKVSHRVLHFTASQLTQLFTLANSSPNVTKISKLDALLAHIWTRINGARQLPAKTMTYLDMTLGLRARVEPPLPSSFLGSPIISAAVSFVIPNEQNNSKSLSDSAASIRHTLQAFTPSAVAAILHDIAFEVSPQRLWRCFLGKKHIMLTTWLHLGLDEADFAGTGSLRHVEPIMPSCDGLVDVLETTGDLKEGHWSRNGVDVSIYLEETVMERLLDDQLLWPVLENE